MTGIDAHARQRILAILCEPLAAMDAAMAAATRQGLAAALEEFDQRLCVLGLALPAKWDGIGPPAGTA